MNSSVVGVNLDPVSVMEARWPDDNSMFSGSGIVNFGSTERRAIGQSDPERFRQLSSITSSVAQSLGFRGGRIYLLRRIAEPTTIVNYEVIRCSCGSGFSSSEHRSSVGIQA